MTFFSADSLFLFRRDKKNIIIYEDLFIGIQQKLQKHLNNFTMNIIYPWIM